MLFSNVLQRVLLLVASDVDALCACKILQVSECLSLFYILLTEENVWERV